MFSRRLADDELRLFSDRIARSLADRPQELAEQAHLEAVAGLLREMGEASHYRFLGIDPTASALEIHEAYERTARMVHPANAFRLGGAGREGVLQVLFERATEAYLTLSAVDRRKRYDRELGPRLWAEVRRTPAASRAEGAVRLVEQARALAASAQVHAAVELLREAVRTAPQADSLALLGTLEAKNPHWLHAAEQHLEQAIRLGARSAGVAELLEEVREKRSRLAAGLPLDDSDEEEEVLVR